MESSQDSLLKRRSHRTNVSLLGKCMCRLRDITDNKGDDALDVIVENISKHGIGFRFINAVKVDVNHTLRVLFALESTQRVSVVECDKNIVVKWTDGSFVGAEFVAA